MRSEGLAESVDPLRLDLQAGRGTMAAVAGQMLATGVERAQEVESRDRTSRPAPPALGVEADQHHRNPMAFNHARCCHPHHPRMPALAGQHQPGRGGAAPRAVAGLAPQHRAPPAPYRAARGWRRPARRRSPLPARRSAVSISSTPASRGKAAPRHRSGGRSGRPDHPRRGGRAPRPEARHRGPKPGRPALRATARPARTSARFSRRG